MGDSLKSNLFISTMSTAKKFGATPISDNHGHVLIGNKLTCHGQAPDDLSMLDDVALQLSIWSNATGNLVGATHDREVPVLGGLESPLKTECDKLHSTPSARAYPSRER